MNIQFDVDLSRIVPQNDALRIAQASEQQGKTGFDKTIQKSLQAVNRTQSEADASIADLLTGKQQDINAVVASVAKADMSFRLLVGVRNKLIEAYKETMRMQG